MEDYPDGVYEPVSLVTDSTCLGFGDESRLDPKHRVLERPRVGCGLDRPGANLLGPACGLAWTCTKCLCNLHNALCNRHGVVQQPCEQFVNATLAIVAMLPAVELNYSLQIEEWWAKWPQVKREQMLRSVELDSVLPGRVKAMVKWEMYHKRVEKARAIQFYPNEATKCQFGPEYYALQKAWTAVSRRAEWGNGVRVTFASGMDGVQLGQWMSDVLVDIRNPRFYERDGKNWDASMSDAHLQVRLLAYGFMTPAFLKFVRDSWTVKGRAVSEQGVLKYLMQGTNKSGHLDTTLGNTINNAAIAYEAMSLLGLRGDIIAAGDDLVIVVDGEFDLGAMLAAERRFGIVPVGAKFASLLDVSFISGYWWYAARERIVFTPKIGRLLARLWWTVAPPSRRQYPAYMRGVAWGIEPLCGNMPVVRELIRPWLTEGPRMVCIPGKNFDVFRQQFDWEEALVWQQLEARYGVSRGEVEDLERVIRGTLGVPCLINHSVARVLMAADLADPGDRNLSHWA